MYISMGVFYAENILDYLDCYIICSPTTQTYDVITPIGNGTDLGIKRNGSNVHPKISANEINSQEPDSVLMFRMACTFSKQAHRISQVRPGGYLRMLVVPSSVDEQ